jgi:hypothetical protein
MAALSPATAQTATTPAAPVNPYTMTEEKKNSYWQGLQPQMRQATDAVTSSVNPFNKGGVGASLLRNVQQPALQALTDFTTGQEAKSQDWEAGQITAATEAKQTNINNLKALAESPNATQQDIENYRAALAGRAPVTVGQPATGTTGTLTPADKTTIQGQIEILKNTDYAANEGSVATLNDLTNKLMGTTGQQYYKYSAAAKKAADVTENKEQYVNAGNSYKQVSEKIPGWITDPANANRASYQANERMEELSYKIDEGTASLDELGEFNKLIAAFKKGGNAGNYNEAVFEALGYGTKATGAASALPQMVQNTAMPNYPGLPGYNPGLPIKYI